MRIFNCHTHIFPDCIALNGYLALRLAGRGLDASSALEALGERYADVMQEIDMDEEESLSLLRSAYPDAASFVLLSMDLDYTTLGDSDHPFTEQLEELARLRDSYGEVVMPFVAADPRRPGLLELVREFIEHRGFTGIAISPSTGFFPFDRRLMPIYEYADTNRIPVCANSNLCAVGVPHEAGGDVEELIQAGIIAPPLDPEWENVWRKATVACHFGHPVHYEYVLSKLPMLKLCMTHAGGPDEWDVYPASSAHWAMRNWSSLVISMVRRHRRVYADIASVRSERSVDRLRELLQDPDIRAKIVYGSNYHTVSLDGDEREFLMDTVRRLGKEDFRRIAFANPRKLLTSRIHPLAISTA